MGKKTKKIVIWSIIGALVVGLVVYNELAKKDNKIDIEFKNLEEPLLENKYSTFLNENKNLLERNTTFEQVVLPSSFIIDSSDSLSTVPNHETQTYQFDEEESLSFEVNVTAEGLYQVYISYWSLVDEYGSSELSVKVNGDFQYSEATQISLQQLWESDNDEITLDRYGNESLPEQNQKDVRLEYPLRDSSKLYDDGLAFKLNSGLNTITLDMLGGSVMIDKITVKSYQNLKSYSEYYKNEPLVDAEWQQYEVEKFVSKSSSSIQAGSSSDPGVTPFDMSRNKLNTISFAEAGDRVDWKVNVEKAGFYNLAFKAMQSDKNSTYYRKLLVNGEVPFEEAKYIPFRYSDKWENVVVGDLEGNPYAIYLNAGENIISFEVNVSKMRIINEKLTKITDEMNDLGLQVKSVTGNSTDKEIDWDMDEYFTDIHERFARWISEVESILEYVKYANGFEGDSYAISDLKNALSNLNKLAEDVNKLPTRLTLLSEGSSCAVQFLAGQINGVKSNVVTFDKFYVYSTDNSLPRATANIFKKAWTSVSRFFLSFFDQNYSAKLAEGEIEIWMGRSRQYVNALQKLIDQEGGFTDKTGIKAKVVLLPDEGKIILSNAANRTPDVACSVSTWIPNEYGMRGAIYDLRQFPDYAQNIDQFNENQLIPLIYDNQLFGLPETENFYVLYYRTDILESLSLEVPNTWDDVVDMLPILDRKGMEFYIPLSSNSSSKSYDATAPFIWQNDGQIYDVENLKSGIDDENTVKALQFMTDLYREYSLPYQVSNFFNEFRYGNMPIGIADYGTYLQLLNAAPEIRGLWGISVVPGIERDGERGETVYRYMSGGQQASMIFKDSEYKAESWEFLKWWASEETQLSFSSHMINTYGKKYLWNTANQDAFQKLNWDKDDKAVIMEQWSWLKEVAKIPGSYIIEREISNIWNQVVFNDANLRSTISDSIIKQDKEISRKMQEFGYMDEQGKVIKTYIYPTAETVKKWKEGGK